MSVLGGVLTIIVALLLIVALLVAVLQPYPENEQDGQGNVTGTYTANGYLPRGGSLQNKPPR